MIMMIEEQRLTMMMMVLLPVLSLPLSLSVALCVSVLFLSPSLPALTLFECVLSFELKICVFAPKKQRRGRFCFFVFLLGVCVRATPMRVLVRVDFRLCIKKERVATRLAWLV